MSAQSLARKGVAFFAAVVIVLCEILVGARAANAQTQTAVEYYYADWNFYFVTAFPDEIAALDGGAFGGAWKRTGQTFDVWTGPTNGALATCRFFSTIFAPKSSHFYTPYAAECASLRAGQGWQYEAIAFYLQLPDANGNCPAGTEVLYRLYNNGMGGAPNHRFIRSAAQFNQMRAAGWVFEGNGNTMVFACVPPSPPAPATPEGIWFGTLTTGANLDGFILDTGVYYFIYTSTTGNNLAGVVQGTLTSSNGNFSSSDALDFPIGHAVVTAVVTGSYTPGATISGSITEAGSIGFSAMYRTAYDQPANLAAAAGTYSGQIASSQGVESATITLDATGALSGSSSGCTFGGTATPHGAVNVLNVVFTFNGGPCTYGTSTFQGFAVYAPTAQEIYGAAPNAARTDALQFVVTKPQ
ncbi:MAG TPA: hypothetical protein VG429_04830 [Casimicrobiaceae bacterium]|jgi:hypothetical protein|nr:hypothetical protein [Casimicrobiaceae bacterium]